MTERQPTPEGAILVAIDVAKHRNEVLIETPGHRRRRRITVPNTREEHDRLVALLTGLDAPVVAGFEATGNYHRPLAHRLLAAGVELRLISSLALARTREAITNGWDKNDPKDAQIILHMLRIGAVQRHHDPLAHGLVDVQELSKTHDMISRAKTELWHRLLTHYLPLCFPEAERFRGNARGDWFFAFLEAFPTPASITALDKEAFIAAAWDVVGRKVSKRRLLLDVYETASGSIGLPVPPGSEAVAMFRMVLAEGRGLIRQRDAIERRAEELLAHDADYQRLRTMPGVGPINALTILAEAGDLRRFRHHRPFLKFCGLDLATHQSGTFRGQARLSKFGNARLRRTCLGSRGKSRSASATTASGTSSSATSRAIGRAPIGAAKRSRPSPPRWRAPRTPSSRPASTTARSTIGRYQAGGPLSARAVGTPSDPVDNVRVFRLDLDPVLRTVRAAEPRTLCLLWPGPLP